MYLIIKEDGYDGYDINYADDEEHLGRMLNATDGMHYSFPIGDIEVIQCDRELSIDELLHYKNK